MTFLPLVERELRVALRKHRPERQRWLVAGICAAGSVLFLLMAGFAGFRGASRDLHQLLCLGGLYTVLRAPVIAGGVFANERREQTLGLLFLSGISMWEFFASKLAGAAAVVFTDLLAIVPMLALPLLMGGISVDVFVATIFCLPNILLFVLAVSLLASVLTDDDGTAVVAASILMGILCVTPPLIYLAENYFSTSRSARDWWLALGPAYAPWMLVMKPGTVPLRLVWWNFAATLVLTNVCFSLAAFALNRLWQAGGRSAREIGWHVRWLRFIHGTADRSRKLARKWLSSNPWVWLAARDRKPATISWLMTGGILGLWAVGCALWPATWPSALNLLTTAFLLNLALRWIILYTGAAALGNARADGTYELLLTTPLHPEKIVNGQLAALREHFHGVCRVVFVVELAMAIAGLLAGLAARAWRPEAVFVYVVAWFAMLTWQWRLGRRSRGSVLAMWAGLNSGRPALAVWKSSGLNSWVWLALLFNLRVGIRGLQKFPSGTPFEFILACALIIMLGLSFVVGRWEPDRQRKRLITEFREIAREPLPDPNDSRFKQWNVRERFPWGWGVVQQQLHERFTRWQAAKEKEG